MCVCMCKQRKIIPDFPEFVHTNNFYDRRFFSFVSSSSSLSFGACTDFCPLLKWSCVCMHRENIADDDDEVGHVIASFQSIASKTNGIQK